MAAEDLVVLDDMQAEDDAAAAAEAGEKKALVWKLVENRNFSAQDQKHLRRVAKEPYSVIKQIVLDLREILRREKAAPDLGKLRAEAEKAEKAADDFKINATKEIDEKTSAMHRDTQASRIGSAEAGKRYAAVSVLQGKIYGQHHELYDKANKLKDPIVQAERDAKVTQAMRERLKFYFV
jgi:hypothetical protein